MFQRDPLLSLGKIIGHSNPETFFSNKLFRDQRKRCLFQGIGRECVHARACVWCACTCVCVCVPVFVEGGSGNIFVNSLLELKYCIIVSSRIGN